MNLLPASAPAWPWRRNAACTAEQTPTAEPRRYATRTGSRPGGAGSGNFRRTGDAEPLDGLVSSYRQAERRFAADRRVLAAINLVESSFGRARSASVAGAQGPMQFLPSTWRRATGSAAPSLTLMTRGHGRRQLPASSSAPPGKKALYAYNPSQLYVNAVLGYARA